MKRAFTLVELLISLSIFSLLLGGIFYALGVELKLWQKAASACQRQQIANAVLTRMVSDIRSAKEVMPASDPEKLELKIEADTVEYSFAEGKIRRRKNGTTAYLTERDDTGPPSFAYPGTKLVEVKLEDFMTKAGTRN